MFVARFVAAAFRRGRGQIFDAAASCATKVRTEVHVCHPGWSDAVGEVRPQCERGICTAVNAVQKRAK